MKSGSTSALLRFGGCLTLLAGPLAADTMRVRMIAVVDTQPLRAWPGAGEIKPLPGSSRVLRPNPRNVSEWKQPEPAGSAFATTLASGFAVADTSGSPHLNLVFDGLVSPRCDGPWIAGGDKGPVHDGPSRVALVSQVLQGEKFARSLAPYRLPEVFICPSFDLTTKYTFEWTGLVLLNGAAEASEEKSSQDFAGNFSLTLADWRAELGKHIPILWVQLPPAPSAWDEARHRNWNRVRDMQAELVAAQPLTTCLETGDLPVLPGTTEFTPEGWAKLAQRAAQALADISATRESCCPPSE